MAGIDFSVGYEREEFLGFLQREFLPNDFKVTIAHVDLTAFNTKYISALTVLGECESLDLVVFEIEHNSQKDARISLAKETYKILKNSFSLRALVIYHAKDSENYRFSFLEYTSDDNNRRETLPPKRYSYLLGKGIATHTPDKYLLEKGRVISAEDLKNRFSVEVLTKEFYNELFLWYQWTLSGEVNVFFPENASNEERLDTKIIRLITRIIFVWFIKQKDLVPDKLFDTDYLTSVLKDFNPQDTEQGNFYNAILQNLFFATLNRAIVDEKGNKRCFAKAKNQTDLKTLYRYADLFKISQEEVVEMFGSVPFLNGGLFECLDKVKRLDGVEKAYYYDGFSRNDNKRANLPNILFFHEERGLISIFKRYNFTVEENAPNDVVVSLDPELLGKVFENLLGVYNPETSQTARNATGSFYTPREIVGYMVDECLKQYLGRTPEVEALFEEDFQKQEGTEEEYLLIAEKLQKVKILDPACGSGAFPMGLLNRMADLLEKILIDKTPYELKLAIIEHCIYGVDIQNIAVQISKLRFFISLICDCEKDETKPNFNIPTLPNLETKFVAANTLIGKKIKASDELSFDPPEIETCKMNLAKIRHEHFSAKTSYQKEKLRKEDESVREKLVELLEKYGKCSLEDAEQLAKWSPYDQNDVADFFDVEWMFGVKDGFNIIIGNPPYVQLQNNGGLLANMYEGQGYETFARTGDIYCLFYEKAVALLTHGGYLCFITSNKWMRAGYGEKLRAFLSKTNPKLLIDFAGVKVFESATVDTNILLLGKEKNKEKTLACVCKNMTKKDIHNLSDYIDNNASLCSFNTKDSWVVLSPIEQSIKQKIESVGTPLKDWDINIYRGVLTGCNEAFIINTEKRNEILANCKDEDERKRTESLIRPILRGRDICRYSYHWANLWLICTHNGVKDKGITKIPRIDINDYPAVKKHLDKYWDRIQRRDDQGDTPYNLRNCAYWGDFFKPKAIWKIIGCNINFAFDDASMVCNNAINIMVGKKEQLLQFVGLMNSRLFKWYLKLTTEAEVQGGGIQLYVTTLEKTLVKLDFSIEFSKIVNMRVTGNKTDSDIDNLIYQMYGLTQEEISTIEQS